MPGQEYKPQPEEEIKEVPKQFDVDPEFLAKLSTMLQESDFIAFKSYISNLKSGSIELVTPLIFQQSFDEKDKRAEFHQFFKDKIPQYITDTIVE